MNDRNDKRKDIGNRANSGRQPIATLNNNGARLDVVSVNLRGQSARSNKEKKSARMATQRSAPTSRTPQQQSRDVFFDANSFRPRHTGSNPIRTSTQQKYSGKSDTIVRVRKTDGERVKEVALPRDKARKIKQETNNAMDVRVVSQKTKMSKEERMRRRQMFLAVCKLCIACILIGALAFGGYMLVSKTVLIEKVTVSGNSSISTETILELSQVKIGDKYFAVHTSEIIENLARNPYIIVTVQKKFPNEISIVVSERRECAAVVCDRMYAILSSDAYVLRLSQVNSDKLLCVSGMSTAGITVGGRIAQDCDYRMSVLIELLEVVNEPPYCDLIVKIDLTQPFAIEVTTDSGMTVNLGDSANLRDKLIKLPAVLENIAALGYSCGIINLSNPQKPSYIGTQGEMATPVYIVPTPTCPLLTPVGGVATATPTLSTSATPTPTTTVTTTVPESTPAPNIEPTIVPSEYLSGG